MPSTSSKTKVARRSVRATPAPATLLGIAEVVLRHMADPVYLADPRGSVVFANDAYRTMVGVADVAVIVAEVLRSREAVERDETISVDGRPRVLTSRHAPILDETGKPIAVSGIYHDVTRRRAAEAAAATQSERLDDLTRLMAEWTFEVDAEFRFRALSPRALDAFGLPPSMLVGKNLLEAGTFIGEHAAVLTPGARSPIRGQLYRTVEPDGTVRHSRISAVPMFDTATAAFIGYRGIGIDITAQIAAERRAANAQVRLHEAIEAIFEGFALYDADDRLIVCNARFRALFPEIDDAIREGVAFEAMLRRSRFGADVSAEEREAAIRQRLAAHRVPGKPFEERLPGNRWVLVGERATRDGGVVSVYTDITELKHRERDLAISESIQRDAREAAEAANQAKSAFLANMSHELRTPLNAIIGFSEIMHNEMFGALGVPKYRDYVRDIHDSGKHLLNLINDVLDFSKIEAGKLVLHEADVSVTAVVQRCHRLMQEIAQTQGVDLACDIPADDPVLRADERKLKQIMLNLLSNAIKFTPHGGAVTTRVREAPDGALTIAVVDTGIGMNPEDIPRALAPFVQLEDPLTRHHQGTGLGLPLTKSLVELHGGTLAVASALGSGTTITARFPATRVQRVASDV